MDLLIAEDDRTQRRMLTHVLERMGHGVVAVSDGCAAWEILSGLAAPRMAILDWMMPGLEGPEICRRVRALETTDPPYLVLLTARDDEESVVEGLELGADDYLTKPFNVNELRARLGVAERTLALQSRLNRVTRALSREAARDSLTGLYNRRTILRLLGREMEAGSPTAASFSVGLADIDHFKRVNDAGGHQVGDDVLRRVARVMADALGEDDILGRYGGEEFLIIARGSVGIFEEMRRLVSQRPLPTRGAPQRVTISIGVAGCKDHASVDALMGCADAALYAAKRAGRDRVIVYAADDCPGTSPGAASPREGR